MYINLWLIFSYTIPAKNPNVRVKTWRRLQTMGAVQLKSSLYVLPFSETNYEHLQWLAKEVEELGGEAVFFQCVAVENVTEAQIKVLFGKARDGDYSRLDEEIRAFLASYEGRALKHEEAVRDFQTGLKKFTRRFRAIQEIDFFPTGRAENVTMLLSSGADRLKVLNGETVGPSPVAVLRREEYQGRLWVTRERPYIDRLASFWLIKRFIDPKAQIQFISPTEKHQPSSQRVYFDMAGGEFTHREQMITFEVLIASFGLKDRGLSRLAGLIRHIDLKENLEEAEEAGTLQDLIDGLVKITPDDHELVQRAFLVFDALYITYQGEK
jgi:hypothetical protein